MYIKSFVCLALLCMPLSAQAQYVSEVWCPDNGDGTYTNPVMIIPTPMCVPLATTIT